MRGIKNINANCFMNTALQVLLNIGKYNNEVVKLYINAPQDHNNEMLKKYLRLLVDYHNKGTGAMSIRQFLSEACARD